MPYTLTKGLLWFLLALLLGVVVGWLLRSIRATRQVRASRHARHDAVEFERLRGRVANLEPLVAENERLKAALGGGAAAAAVAMPPELPDDAVDTGTEAAIDARVPADEPEPEPEAEPERELGLTDAVVETVAPEPDVPTGEPVEPIQAFAATSSPDLDAAAAVLGRQVVLDELTTIEGIGPAIADLLNRIGIQTWAELGRTEVSLLRTMLADAGPTYSVHDPQSWPAQAALLADGRWAEFQALTERLDGGQLGE